MLLESVHTKEESALERAEEIASALYPHQIEGSAFLLGRRRPKGSLHGRLDVNSLTDAMASVAQPFAC